MKLSPFSLPCCVTESLEPGHAPRAVPAFTLAEMASEESHHCDSPAGQGSGKARHWPADCTGSEIGKKLTAVSAGSRLGSKLTGLLILLRSQFKLCVWVALAVLI